MATLSVEMFHPDALVCRLTRVCRSAVHVHSAASQVSRGERWGLSYSPLDSDAR